jgi:nucleotide-binding universal stress UspA family protein
MALKDILVHLNQAGEVDARLKLAIDLANRHVSHLTALFVEEWNQSQSHMRATAEMGLIDGQALERLDRRVTAEISQSASRLRRTLEAASLESSLDAEWREGRWLSARIVRQLLPYTDLCILGHEGLCSTGTADSTFCESVLMSAGVPILFVPRSVSVATLGSRIIVAWDASRAALRAVNDAIDLIERAESTVVLNVDTGSHTQSEHSLLDLAARLRRHGSSVAHVQLKAHPESVPGVIHAKAQELGADLIVCGAFGHSRLRENLFGGVTRSLLDNTKIPLLLSR